MKLSSAGRGRGAAGGTGSAAADMGSTAEGTDSTGAVVLLWRRLLGPLVLLVGAKAQMGENAGDVVEHGSVHSLDLLGEVGVVCEVLADLVLLLA
jgi:hypothetical protein